MRQEIIVIGERGHDKARVGAALERGREIWMRHPVRAVLSMPAFTHGATRARLVQMLGTDAFRAKNLLWPHHQPGAWDKEAAREIASAVIHHLPDKFVTLGARVRDAFWGEVSVIETTRRRIEVLVLPHPSGRSRVCNCEVEMEIVREAFQAFVR